MYPTSAKILRKLCFKQDCENAESKENICFKMTSTLQISSPEDKKK